MSRRPVWPIAALIVAASVPVLAQGRGRRAPLPTLPSAPASASASAAPVGTAPEAPPPTESVPAADASAESAEPAAPPRPHPTFVMADARTSPVVSAPVGPPRGRLRFGAEIGWRGQRITHAGYDPFSTDDWHGFFSVSGWYVPLARGPLSLAATGGWDIGTDGATARAQPTSLTMHRLWLAPEGRLQVGELGHAFVRVGPSVWHMRAELSDASVSAPLVRRPWLVGADAAVGARARALELRDERGAWMVGYVGAEVGYAYVPTVKMDMQPKRDEVTPRDVVGVRLPDFAASGFTLRLTVSSAF